MRALKLIVMSLVALGIGFLMVRHGGDFKWPGQLRSLPPGAGGPSDPGDVGPVVRLDPFLVTEWEDERERHLTVTFELEVEDNQGRDDVIAHTSKIRSEVLALLADIQLYAIGDTAEYEALKKQVQNRIQPIVPNHRIRRVLITELLSN
jgi:flagellar basal body-associated protein FliL